MLKLIGIEKTDGTSDMSKDECSFATVVKAKPVQSITYDRVQVADMFLCPYKYLLDYVLNPNPIFGGDLLIQKGFENILIENTWKVLQNTPQTKALEKLSSVVSQEALKMKKYFSFLKDTEILDLQRRAENYIKAKVFTEENKNKNVRPVETVHMLFRKTFGDAWFKEDLSNLPERHPYKSFEQLAKIEENKKIYSTHSAPKTENKQLVESMLSYINNTDKNMEHVGSWCTFCANKGICLAPFAESKG
jgi:hypothetical protein